VLNAAVRWALSSGKSSEDLLLALVAPDTYRLLLRWRRALFGEEGEMRGRLDEARRQLYALSGTFEPLARSSVSVRSKGLWSTFHKVQQRGQSVNDVLALRVVVDGDELDCYRVLAAAHSLWPSVDGRRKDYVAAPKGNGYRALHDTVTLPCGTPMEIQVRTVEMHAHAEIGDAAHRLYKGAAFSMPTAALRGLAAI
jgi:(p)ppGpp synthase/HD superfamily hydrolase